jgi:hypothetical protein
MTSPVIQGLTPQTRTRSLRIAPRSDRNVDRLGQSPSILLLCVLGVVLWLINRFIDFEWRGGIAVVLWLLNICGYLIISRAFAWDHRASLQFSDKSIEESDRKGPPGAWSTGQGYFCGTSILTDTL